VAAYAAAMPRRRRSTTPKLAVAAWAAACAAATLAGCGGGHSQSHARGGGQGRELFTQACGACHTLRGHNDARHQGGDLLDFHATRPQMLQLAGEMPVRHPLSPGQLDAVVTFVMSLEARTR
jgi:mono/diheme cytochrome c family protein